MKNLSFLILISACLLGCSAGDKPVEKHRELSISQNKRIAKTIDGKEIYQANCLVCHGENGDMMAAGAKDITISTLSLEETINQITNGVGMMMPYKGILDEASIEAVAKYSMELRKPLKE